VSASASSLDFGREGEIMRLMAAMDQKSDKEIAGKKQRDQMLRLVAKSFYNELTNYGVSENEVIHMASHLLDNLLAKESKPAEGVEYYNGIFNLSSVKDEWTDGKQVAVQHVTLQPLQAPDVGKVSKWLKVPAIRESFVQAFPEKQSELRNYFDDPTREYFGIHYDDHFADIIHRIRDGERAISPAQIGGLVTFPSFHVTAALLVAWGGWVMRYLRWPLLLFNLYVCASAIFIGAHYFVDVIGGAVITAVAIFGANLTTRGQRTNRGKISSLAAAPTVG